MNFPFMTLGEDRERSQARRSRFIGRPRVLADCWRCCWRTSGLTTPEGRLNLCLWGAPSTPTSHADAGLLGGARKLKKTMPTGISRGAWRRRKMGSSFGDRGPKGRWWSGTGVNTWPLGAGSRGGADSSLKSSELSGIDRNGCGKNLPAGPGGWEKAVQPPPPLAHRPRAGKIEQRTEALRSRNPPDTRMRSHPWVSIWHPLGRDSLSRDERHGLCKPRQRTPFTLHPQLHPDRPESPPRTTRRHAPTAADSTDPPKAITLGTILTLPCVSAPIRGARVLVLDVMSRSLGRFQSSVQGPNPWAPVRFPHPPATPPVPAPPDPPAPPARRMNCRGFITSAPPLSSIASR